VFLVRFHTLAALPPACSVLARLTGVPAEISSSSHEYPHRGTRKAGSSGSAMEGLGAMDHYLIVVSRGRPELWQELRQNFAHAEGVEIILDRRQWQRWTRPQGDSEGWSSSHRDVELQSHGFVVIPRI